MIFSISSLFSEQKYLEDSSPLVALIQKLCLKVEIPDHIMILIPSGEFPPYPYPYPYLVGIGFLMSILLCWMPTKMSNSLRLSLNSSWWC